MFISFVDINGAPTPLDPRVGSFKVKQVSHNFISETKLWEAAEENIELVEVDFEKEEI